MEQTKEGQAVRSDKTFPFYRLSGTHRQIGQQFGEACKELILKHADYALERLRKRVNLPGTKELEEAALLYRPFVQNHAPFFDEEIQGIAEGAGITLGEAYFLQLRAEIYRNFHTTDECTSYAAMAEATSNGVALIGQNADLPDFYSEVGVVIEFVPDEGPAQLMLTPAGQVSYLGISNRGMAAFANFLTCDGWRTGFPRYLMSRLALTCNSVDDAVARIRGLHRASSRNLMLMDATGKALDIETIPTRDSLIHPENGLLAHSNHFVSDDLLDEERNNEDDLRNSRIRLARMKELLEEHHGKLNAEVMKDILRDRQTCPDALCIEPDDEPNSSSITFASLIAEPEKGQMWIAIGPPSRYEYKLYQFSS